MGYHARLSPSSASRWTDCTASIGAQEGFPNTTNEASRHGTCCHQLSAECLEHNTDPSTYLGRVMWFPAGGREDWREAFGEDTVLEAEVVVTDEMVEASQAYISFVRQQVQLLGAELIVEQQVPIGHVTGEPDARGTADTVMLAGEALVTIDAKFGRGKVYAYDVIEPAGYDVLTGEPKPPVLRMNLQLALYLLGSYEKYGLMGSFTRAKGVIVQPYLNHVSEYECSIEELLALGEWLSERAETTRTNPSFKPSNKNCFFCKAKFDCHARTALVLSEALDGFDDVDPEVKPTPKPIKLPDLGRLYSVVPLIRSWCDDIEKKTFNSVESGVTVIGDDGKPMKLVEGRKGHRQWDDAVEIENMLKTMRLAHGEMYVSRIISPSEAEKLAPKTKKKRGQPVEEKSVIGKTQWGRLQEHIVIPDGKPTLALGSDPRQPMKSASDMDDVTSADNSDLF